MINERIGAELKKQPKRPTEQEIGHNKAKTGINTFLFHKQGLNGIRRKATLNVFSGLNKDLEVFGIAF